MCSYAYTDTDTHLQLIDNHSHPSCQSQRGWPGKVDPVPAQGQSITCPHNPRPPALLGLGPLFIPSLPSPLLSLLPNFPSVYKTHSHLSHLKSTLAGSSPRAACPVRVTTFRFSFTHLCTVQLDVDNFCNLNCPYPPKCTDRNLYHMGPVLQGASPDSCWPAKHPAGPGVRLELHWPRDRKSSAYMSISLQTVSS